MVGNNPNRNPSVKIFNDTEGKHVVDISLIEYLVDKKDENGNSVLDGDGKELKESKGHRIKFEFTKDGWKTKRIIYLQDKEAIELLSVIYGRKKSAKFQRNDPHLKFLNIENQGEHSFLTFKFSSKEQNINEQYYGKVTSFISFNISTFVIALLSYEMSRENGIKLSLDNILNQINFLLPSKNEGEIVKPIVKEKTETEKVESSEVNELTEVTDGQIDINKCADCGNHIDPTKYQKIIDFSNKKFKRTVCYNCQQKLK